MFGRTKPSLAEDLRQSVHPITGQDSDYDRLLAQIGNARFVLLGEATHGSHEFYAERLRITQRLIAEHGFHALAVEADWPDAYRVNRYVQGAHSVDGDSTAIDALAGFQRFPHWMWRNTDVQHCVDWLRAHNDALPPAARAGFYGLDLYSLFTSMEEVLHYLEQVDPAAARQARDYYACFDQHGADTQAYGYATGLGLSDSCQEAVMSLLQQLQQREAQYAGPSADAQRAFFHARQNARLVQNAEEYYRTMFRGRVSSWNLRDRHMADTLDDLAAFIEQTSGTPARIVVWAHNSHLGDARATRMGELGEWNLGQLVRERHPGEAFLVGFTTYDGQVMAASQWDGPAFVKNIVPARPGSVEALLHEVHAGNHSLLLSGNATAARQLAARRLERAIGVIYRPETELASHYFEASLSEQFDAVIHIDTTTAVVPLPSVEQSNAEIPETYPEGL